MPYIAVARNVMTGKLVRLPMATRDEVKRMKWYPHNDYVLIKILTRKRKFI